MQHHPPPAAPGPGQESVWDYPRPPKVEPVDRRIEVHFGGVALADTSAALRVLETSHPPTYYLPRADVAMEYLSPIRQTSWCEWKGGARYYDIAVGDRHASAAAWCYPSPRAGYEAIAGHIAFYCHLMDRCTVGGEEARPQPGNFYGGWITNELVGPFKGEPGSHGW
jgi:uncharacterized protein (DUF427 family)